VFVGDDHLSELRGQVGRLGDHPDPGFRSGITSDDAADVIIIYDHHRTCDLLRAERRQ
jgi:hypothetical protein